MKKPAGQARSFQGFPPDGMRFLRELAKHNDRAWFAPRKAEFERTLQEPLRALLADATAALHAANIPLGADPKRSAFRIYRDVRFSPDKRPFKTNLGAYLSYDGSHGAPGGLYVHIQPKESFVAIAFYEIDKPLLQRWREAMAAEPKRFATVLRALERNGLRITEHEDTLKRMPRGFESFAESPIAKYFRYRSFTTGEDLSDADVCSPQLVDRMVNLARRARPLLDYGWSLE